MRKFTSLIVFCFLFFGSILGARQVYAAFSFTINGELSKVTDKNQEISVPLTIISLPTGDSFFRASFQKEASSSYFGYMKDSSDNWVKITSPLTEGCNKYQLITGPGDKTLTLKLKIGDDNVVDNGDYSVVVHRITSSCGSNSSQKSSINIDLPPVPTSTPTPTPAPSPTPTDSPPTATPTLIPPTSTPTPYAKYRINPVKPLNDNNEGLRSVDVYVDGNNIGHEVGYKNPLDLYFCSSCKCLDSTISCGFGDHTIKLVKSGYDDWSETKNFSNGNSYETNPTMNVASATSTSTPTPTNTPTPTKTSTPKPTLRLSPTPSLKVTPSVMPTLTITESVVALTEPSLSPTVLGATDDASPKKKLPLVAFGIIGAGAIFLGLAAFSFLKNKSK